MKFSTLLSVIIIGYVLYYGWMIFSDLFLKKGAAPVEKIGEEDEVDVSGMSEEFQPEQIRKQSSRSQTSENGSYPLRPINTGAINIQDFLATIEDFGNGEEFSDLGRMVAEEWGARIA